MDVITIVFGILVLRNFDEGLKPFVQRGKQKMQDLELNKTNTNDTWKIDE